MIFEVLAVLFMIYIGYCFYIAILLPFQKNKHIELMRSLKAFENLEDSIKK